MTKAIEIITDAYERCNRLSPGEVLSADDAAFGFRRLNILVDELAAKTSALFYGYIVKNTQTGNIVLGAAPWASVAPGDSISGISCNGLALDKISLDEFSLLDTASGIPRVYAHDGLSNVFLHPSPQAVDISIIVNSSVAKFVDQTTDYVLKDGWANALGARLAVIIAPNIIGKIPAELIRNETIAMNAVLGTAPKTIHVGRPF